LNSFFSLAFKRTTGLVTCDPAAQFNELFHADQTVGASCGLPTARLSAAPGDAFDPRQAMLILRLMALPSAALQTFHENRDGDGCGYFFL
jgi:hypothetical protein